MRARVYNKKDEPLPHAKRCVLIASGRLSADGTRHYKVLFTDDPIPTQLITAAEHASWFVVRGC